MVYFVSSFAFSAIFLTAVHNLASGFLAKPHSHDTIQHIRRASTGWTMHYSVTDRDIPGDSAGDVNLTDGDALVVGLDFWYAFASSSSMF